MTVPIGRSISAKIPPDANQLRQWLSQHIVSPLLRLLDLANEHSWDYVASTGTVSWDLNAQGALFVSHTSGAAITVSVPSTVSLASLRPERQYVIVIHNTAGVAATPAFPATFRVTVAGIADGATASYRFIVKHPSMTVLTETLLQSE